MLFSEQVKVPMKIITNGDSYVLNSTVPDLFSYWPLAFYMVVDMFYIDYWRPIQGYEGLYSISYYGQIRSHDMLVNSRWGAKRLKKGRILKPIKDKNGYLQVYLCKNVRKKMAKAHRLVAQEFIPNPKNYLQMNHIDGIKSDNRVENLEWVTSKQNIIHAYKTGLNKPASGENHGRGRAKLTKEKVLEIRSMLLQGIIQTEIAKKFGVDRSTISMIKLRKSWSWL